MAGLTVTRRGIAERVSSVQPRPGPGLYLPAGWGTFWKAARGASSVARVAVVGDSIGRGYFASNLNTNGWAALVTASLQASYGDGGSGFQGVVDTPGLMTTLGVPGGAQTNYASQQVATTGTWSNGNDNSPGSASFYSNTAASTITFKVRGTSVTLYYQKASANASAVNWTIDGAAQTAINMNAGSTSVASVTVSGLSSGLHTVVVTAPGTTYAVLYGCSGTNANGVVMHNFSRYGAGAGTFTTGASQWSGGPNFPCDLLIYALGVNDAAAGGAGDTWTQNAANTLNAVRAVANPQTDILLLLNHIGSDDQTIPLYPTYAARARGLAEAYGAALLDLWCLGRNSWAYWNALGYWSDGSGSGASGSNAVHPSDSGHAYIASQVLPLLI